MKKALILSLLEKIVNRQFLFVLLSNFLFPIFSNAQGIETVQIVTADKLIIKSHEFKLTQIEIFDVTGNRVVIQSAVGEPVPNVPVHLRWNVFR